MSRRETLFRGQVRRIIRLELSLRCPGFADVPGKKELTVTLTRIMMPFLLFIALGAKAMGVLNAKGVFGIPAVASAFFNIGSIGTGLLVGIAAVAWWFGRKAGEDEEAAIEEEERDKGAKRIS